MEILENNENYFFHWATNYSLSELNLKFVSRELYANVHQPTRKYLDDEGSKLQDNGEERQFKEINFEEEKKSYNLSNFFETFEEDSCVGMKGSSIGQATTLEMAISPLVEAYIHIQVGDIDWAKRNVMWVRDYLALCKRKYPELCSDYILGVQYLSTLLKIEIFLKEGHPESIEQKLASCRYENLPNKGKAMVWAARWKFLESIANRNLELSIENLRGVIALDERNWVWPYILAMRKHAYRKVHRISKPDEEEITATVDAMQLCDPEYKAACMAGFCQVICEILKWRPVSRDESLNIGDQHFDSSENIIQFIKKEARYVLESKDVFFGELIRYGEIFCFTLPEENQDYDFAEKCYQKALKRKPGNSKALHKMGLLKLTKRKDWTEAVDFFQRATEHRPHNFSAWLDYIKTLLGHPSTCSAKLEEAFHFLWQQNCWTEKEVSDFTFLHGCFYFVQGNVGNAMEKWVKMSTHKTSLIAYFNGLKVIRKRYLWDTQERSLMRLENICLKIQNHIADCDDDSTVLMLCITQVMQPMTNNNPKTHKNQNLQNAKGNHFDPPRPYGRNSQPSQADMDDNWRSPSSKRN